MMRICLTGDATVRIESIAPHSQLRCGTKGTYVHVCICIHIHLYVETESTYIYI